MEYVRHCYSNGGASRESLNLYAKVGCTSLTNFQLLDDNMYGSSCHTGDWKWNVSYMPPPLNSFQSPWNGTSCLPGSGGQWLAGYNHDVPGINNFAKVKVTILSQSIPSIALEVKLLNTASSRGSQQTTPPTLAPFSYPIRYLIMTIQCWTPGTQYNYGDVVEYQGLSWLQLFSTRLAYRCDRSLDQVVNTRSSSHIAHRLDDTSNIVHRFYLMLAYDSLIGPLVPLLLPFGELSMIAIMAETTRVINNNNPTTRQLNSINKRNVCSFQAWILFGHSWCRCMS